MREGVTGTATLMWVEAGSVGMHVRVEWMGGLAVSITLWRAQIQVRSPPESLRCHFHDCLAVEVVEIGSSRSSRLAEDPAGFVGLTFCVDKNIDEEA